MCSPEPGKGRGGGGDGLSEFWSCLDPKQRESLLTINGRSVQGALDCDLCRDLVGSATLALEEEAKVDAPPPSPASSSPNASAAGGGGGKGKPKPPKQKPKMGAVGLRVIGDRAFVADWVGGPEVKRKGPCFVKYMAGVYVMQSSKALDKAVREMAAFQAPWEAVAVERGCYCRGKILLRVVDMLTYPRPVRKFQILVEKNMELMTLREMMLAHVRVDSILRLVLLTRGRPLAHSNNRLTLVQLGFKSRQQLVVSQVLGGSTQDETGVEEKNRQFVGDLLFGGGGGVSGEARRSLLKNRTPFPSSSSSTLSRGPNLNRAMRGGKAATAASPTIPPSPPPLPSSNTPHDPDAVDENGVGKPPRGTGGSSENDSAGPDSASPKGAGIEELLDLVAVEGDTGNDTAAERLADGIAGVGVEGEAGGEPGTGRVPSLLANHGFQVLGKTLSRLACYQVAKAWRAELQAREHETRLLEELEAEAGGGVEEEGTASKRRTKKAKKKERDKKRREEEKRLQQQEEDRKGQLRLEKMRQAEERLEEERRAKLLQERAEHERQAQQWKLAQEKRVIAEREQLQAQMSLLRVADEEPEAMGMSEAVKSAPTPQAVGASGGLGGGRGKDKKNKGKKQHQQQKQRPQQQQQRQQHQRVSVKGGESTSSGADNQGPSASGSQEHKQQQLHAHAVAPSRASNGIMGSRVTTTAGAGGGGGGGPGESVDGNSTSSSGIAGTISQFAGIAHARPQHLQQPRLAPLPASQAVGVAAAGVHDPSPQPSTGFPPASQQQQQQQYRQSQHVPPGPIAPPPTARSSSSLSPQHSSTAVPSADYAPQYQHVGVCTTASSLGVDSRDRIGTTPGLATGVISAVAPVATVTVSTGLPPSTSASPSASAVVLTGTGATAGGGANAGAGVPLVTACFCAFCGGRLVAVTANFCAFCGQRVMRSPEPVERVPSPPLPSCPGLVMPTPQQQQVQQAQQPLLSRAVTPPHHHGPVGGGRAKQRHGLGHAHSQPPPPSQQQHQQQHQAQAVPPSCSSRGNIASAASASYLQQDVMPITNNAVGDETGVAIGGGGGGGDDGSRSGAGHGPGEGAGSGSGSLPFFQQFRGAKGSGGCGGGDAHVATVGAGVSAAPGAGRPARGGGEEAAKGEATAHGESNGSSTLEGILEGVIGPLGGGEGESGGVNGARHPW